MAAAPSRSVRVLCESLRSVRRRPTPKCVHSQSSRRGSANARCYVSTATAHLSEMEVEAEAPPRWSQTPSAMRGTVKPRFWKDKTVEAPEINKDPRRLDDVYIRFLGPGGEKLLSEETKWLAVTHKSFDHGRRGFNDRLAFLGRRIYELQTSLTLLATQDSSRFIQNEQDPHGRLPFQHPATEAIETISDGARTLFTHHKQISKLAAQYGIPEIVRWVPQRPESLVASGADMVYAQAVFAILGGLALEQGSAVANRIATQRILAPMGLKMHKLEELDSVRE